LAPHLDRRAIAKGAAAALVLAVMPGVVLRLLVGDELTGAERNAWVLAVLAFLAGFGLAGYLAARSRPEAPYRHAAAAAALAFALFLAFTLARRAISGDGLTVVLVVNLVVLFQIAVSTALVAALVASRRRG
jgi:hypothetical protein